MVQDLVKTREELEEIAGALASEIANPNENIVSRYLRVIYDQVSFMNGKKYQQRGGDGNINKEFMDRGIYNQCPIDDLVPSHNFRDLVVARDLRMTRFPFAKKNVELPPEQEVFFEEIPSEIDFYNLELAEFTKEHPNTRFTRVFAVEQRVIVNSKGGVAIQSIPFFRISYSHGYEPIPTSRELAAVCTSAQDIHNYTKLIAFIPDPTIDKKVKKASSFSEAFHELYLISKLRHGSLEEAGIPLAGLYDVVVLTGTPAHEVFGHHFEEPVRFLNYGESATFKAGQDIKNDTITLKDDPHQRIDNLRVQGFTHVDAYGRKRETRTHIKDGKCLEFLGSEYADPEMLRPYLNVDTNMFLGNASQHLDGRFPQARMSCTVLDGKTEEIDLEGKILIVSQEGHTSPQDKTYSLGAREAYVVRNGEPQRIVPLRITGAINQALANVTLLEDWNYNIGCCGKPSPLDEGYATIIVSELTRNQLWRQQQVYPVPVSPDHLQILRGY
ncbi:MAG: metallopeptidase TldD-related protein [Nanoarchaeota archaeon]|nr:metallopeptidase TldD-related protein [Nanoarchaeota archaeon]